MEQILKNIKEYNTIIIHGHQRPDGDCYGSQFGLKGIINASFPEKKVYIVGGQCELASFLGEMDVIPDELYTGALAIVVDTATAERVSDQRFLTADYVIKIDHHIPVDNYGNYQYVDDNKPACCQIITELYQKFSSELVLSKEAAVALYTGILTDTGRFKFDSVHSDTFRTAALLLDKGVDISYIDNKLSVETINSLKLRGYVLLNFEMTEAGFAYIKMTRDVIEKFGVSDEDAASQVSTISTIEGCPVWGLFMDYPNEIRIRLRSRGPAIDALANKYNGGGHAKACGAKLANWEQLPEFINDVDELLKNIQ